MPVSGPLRTLQRPQGCGRPTEAKFVFCFKRFLRNWPYVAHFLARSGCLGQRPDKAEIMFCLKQFLLTSASIPDGPCQCLAPSGPSSGLKVVEGQLRPNLFFVSNGSSETGHMWPISCPGLVVWAKGLTRPKLFFASNSSF